MSDWTMPWYVRAVVGIGAWITAIVMMMLGAAIVFLFFGFKDAGSLTAIGVVYLGFGLVLMNNPGKGVFVQQIAVAVSAAGAALIPVGIGVSVAELWQHPPPYSCFCSRRSVTCDRQRSFCS